MKLPKTVIPIVEQQSNTTVIPLLSKGSKMRGTQRRTCVLVCLTTVARPAAPFLCGVPQPSRGHTEPIWRSPTWATNGFSREEGRCHSNHAVRVMSVECSATATRAVADAGVETAHNPTEAASRQETRKRTLASATKKDNPRTDRFQMKKFHHVEFYCGDATAAASRFVHGLGMTLVAKSDQSTGNTQHASYVVQSNDLRFVCTAPYSLATVSVGVGDADGRTKSKTPLPGFDAAAAHAFFARHGMAGRAIAVEVDDARAAYEQCTNNGGVGIQPPTFVEDADKRGGLTISEVHAYGDVVLRFISYGGESGEHSAGSTVCTDQGKAFSGTFLPNFRDVEVSPAVAARGNFGLQRADHIVGNVWDMLESVDYLAGMTGMHEFAEFCAGDIGTVDSGLNSIVLASNSELVLLPLNEPTFGTAKKSQIQTYLEQNDGPGLQHMALKTNDIFRTMRLIRANSHLGGFDFMDSPGPGYYRDVPKRIPSLSESQVAQLEELGLLADKDDEGVLLQVFTKPIGDRPTLFFEIIQRIGCAFGPRDGHAEGDWIEDNVDDGVKGGLAGSGGAYLQKGGCGGFGLGNFKALFESIEKYESTLAVGADEGTT